jgi:hypothetical protein
MEQPRWTPDRSGDLPPPLGALYENTPDVLDRLRDLNDKDPAFASWVLLRSNELMEILRHVGLDIDDGVKEAITQSLIEAYDIREAKISREQIARMFEGEG